MENVHFDPVSFLRQQVSYPFLGIRFTHPEVEFAIQSHCVFVLLQRFDEVKDLVRVRSVIKVSHRSNADFHRLAFLNKVFLNPPNSPSMPYR